MAKQPDAEREERIAMEILVDCYEETEQSLGWYYYLDNRLSFPFQARWGRPTTTSVTVVEVLGMAPEEDCMQDMCVAIRYRDASGEDEFTVPLAELEAVNPDPDTAEAIADWQYWLAMGHEL